MYSNEDFIKDWNANNIEPANVVEVYVFDKHGGHIAPLEIVHVTDPSNPNDYEAYDLWISSTIAGADSIHTLGERIFTRYHIFDGYINVELSYVYNDTDELESTFD